MHPFCQPKCFPLIHMHNTHLRYKLFLSIFEIQDLLKGNFRLHNLLLGGLNHRGVHTTWLTSNKTSYSLPISRPPGLQTIFWQQNTYEKTHKKRFKAGVVFNKNFTKEINKWSKLSVQWFVAMLAFLFHWMLYNISPLCQGFYLLIVISQYAMFVSITTRMSSRQQLKIFSMLDVCLALDRLFTQARGDANIVLRWFIWMHPNH